MADINNHYWREHRIYTLMKWILRVYRRDPERATPLVMVDAGERRWINASVGVYTVTNALSIKMLGSNHGLFSMVAGVSGAHAIAFEPQTNLRSKSSNVGLDTFG